MSIAAHRAPRGSSPGTPRTVGRAPTCISRLGVAGQDGVAVLLGLDRHGGVEVDGHRQAVGDRLGLIDVAGAGAADVQLLQADDVGLMLGDDAGDAVDVQLAIDADAAMDVVGEQAGHEVRSGSG